MHMRISDLQKEIVIKESVINHMHEKQASLNREIDIKASQLNEFEKRIEKVQDELDLSIYKLQDQQKDLTETKLKSDVLVSTNNGLVTEKAHLVTELKETRELYNTYEQKCADLMKELHIVNSSFQELKRANISHDENIKQRDDKITAIKTDFEVLNTKHEALILDHGSLKV